MALDRNKQVLNRVFESLLKMDDQPRLKGSSNPPGFCKVKGHSWCRLLLTKKLTSSRLTLNCEKNILNQLMDEAREKLEKAQPLKHKTGLNSSSHSSSSRIKNGLC